MTILTAHTNTQRNKLVSQKLRSRRFWQYAIAQRFGQIRVPDTPHFDFEETVEWFTEQLREHNLMVEFGSGGSTFLSARLNTPFITTESDPYFLRALKRKIAAEGLLNPNQQHYRYANIGLTGLWGYPVLLGWPSAQRLARFAAYSEFPNEAIDQPYESILVFIDGRFRVACALKALAALQTRTKWTLVIDDYKKRPQYSVVEMFAPLRQMVGRMAVFTAPVSLNESALANAIATHVHDTR